MTQTDYPGPHDEPLSMAARLFWSVLILATLYLCYFHNLGVIGLVGPDEPRYAWIARDMTESGDWVTPRLYGKPWFEKPVLYYWAAALSFKLFGVSETTARLPSALAALLATLAMAWLAWRIYGAWTARWLLLLLPTTVGMIGFSHAAATDMPFAATLTIAMVFAAIILGLVPTTRSNFMDGSGEGTASAVPNGARTSGVSTPEVSESTGTGTKRTIASLPSYAPFLCTNTPTRLTLLICLFLFGFFLGLATLAKGPAAIVLSGGGVLFWAAFTRRWRDAFRCLHPLAIASFCLTALPWYILCSRRNPDFFRVFIIEHNFKRYLTPEFQHIQPFWFYVPVLLIAFTPWTLALVWSAIFGALSTWRRRPSDATLLALSWVIFCLVFFSVSKSKLPGYILPAILPIGLLLARSCAEPTPEGNRTFRWIRASFSFLGFPGAIVLLWFGRSYAASTIQTEKMFSTAFTFFLFGFAALLLANRGSRNGSLRRTAPLCVVPVLVLVSSFNVTARPWLTPDPSGKSLALNLKQIQPLLSPDSDFYVASMKRGQQFGLSFYLHREIQIWDPENPRKGFLLLPMRDCDPSLVKAPWGRSRDSIALGSTGWFAYRVFPEFRSPTSK